MASVREVSSIAEDLLCPICLSIFQDPHMLACSHNFCFSCLESCFTAKGQHKGLCPECRAPFDLQDAVRNRVLSNLSEKAQLLKLEEGLPAGGAGNHYFCEEHEEPLKLFCIQDEVPICVICRDLPQHQGHSFLPFRNAVKVYQEKLKASQTLLENGEKWAAETQSQQLKEMEKLENQSLNLCGNIFIGFEELREILNEQEESMLETVKEMKEDNLARMTKRLEYLKAYAASHTETISSIRAALKLTSEFAFLKGTKELLGRIQDCLNEKGGEADEGSQRAKEDEEKQSQAEQDNENRAGSKGDQVLDGEGEADEEATRYAEEDEEGDIVPIDPGLEELQEFLHFESWKEMVRSIGLREVDVPDSVHDFPPPEEDMLPPEGSSTCEAAKEEAEAAVARPAEASPCAPGRGSLGGHSSGPRSTHRMPGSLFSVPRHPFPPLPFCSWAPMQTWRAARAHRGTPQKPQGWHTWRDWADPWKQFSHPQQGQGRRYPQGMQRAQASGGESSKKEPPKPREAHASGQRKEEFNKHMAQSSRAPAAGQGQGAVRNPPARHPGKASGGRGAQSRPQTPHRGGYGRGWGSGSARGAWNK
ncbi:Nuclear factor 7, brain [Varanus komodoensis]|uniref:E3 ubiquitin-protein ligase TRIM31-like n=1 Tax=Varanus komodoensis TaxID=61221 RepID=UPI001CF77070|nr:E3 ubiquitin-protein ligase TRIM31-like [Varanus komodoensis]XP_044275549.1 E3 ubiquitin-protein ligase TRIM31-like [Varanus komodoensis]KAF7236228.1 Nuclear factor 7, brain [Varanus komodoensis]